MLINAIKTTNRTIGNWMQYLIMTMVFVQFLIVIVRYVFSTNSIMVQESILYMFATSFMLAMAHTFMKGGHVFLDILFVRMNDRQKAWVYLLGGIFLLMPTIGTITFYSYDFVLSAWKIREGGMETFSIPYVYLLKTVILVFCVQMLAHGIVIISEASQFLRGKTNTYDIKQEKEI